jgi:hypothetical protein
MQASNDQHDSNVVISKAVKVPRNLGPQRADGPRRTCNWGQGSSSGRVVRTVRTAGEPRSWKTRFATL